MKPYGDHLTMAIATSMPSHMSRKNSQLQTSLSTIHQIRASLCFVKFDNLPNKAMPLHSEVAEEGETGPLNLDEAMCLHIARVLKMAKGKFHGPGGARDLLGINPNTLRGRMNKFGVRYGRGKMEP